MFNWLNIAISILLPFEEKTKLSTLPEYWIIVKNLDFPHQIIQVKAAFYFKQMKYESVSTSASPSRIRCLPPILHTDNLGKGLKLKVKPVNGNPGLFER